MKFNFSNWISFRLLFSKSQMLTGSGPLALGGLILGVSVLFVSQSVMTGFENSLKKAMIDVTSDIQIVKRGRLIESWDQFSSDVLKKDDRIVSASRFAYAEAVIASKGKISGVLVQGFFNDEVAKTLDLNQRIKSGSLPPGPEWISIGQGLAKKFSLSLGDEISIAVPLTSQLDNGQFRRKAEGYKVAGVFDFGKNEWNDRLVLMDLSALQKLTDIGDRFTGAFLKLKNSTEAQAVSENLSDKLGPKYSITNWFDLNRNLFEAVSIEKVVIFFVVFLIVLVAAFNISSSLYVLIKGRSKDIAILKSLGMSSANIQKMFLTQGFLVGSAGAVGGFILGSIFSHTFMWLQSQFSLISGSVYKIDSINTQASFGDFLTIYISTVIVCLFAAWAPSRQASELSVVEGLRQV